MGNQATPLATDAYSRFMAALFDEKQLIGVSTGFLSMFGRLVTGAKTLFSPDANVVEIDIMRGNEKLAATIHRGTEAVSLGGTKKTTATQKFTTFSRQYPLIEETAPITATQLNSRVAGENPYARITKGDRARLLALEHHQEHIRRIVRTMEFLAKESVLNGKQPAIIGTANEALIYDFKRLASHTITVGTGWNQASPDILGDIDGGCELIRQDGHVMPDFIVIGGTAMGSFISDTTVKEQADNRRFELINVSTNNPVPDKLAHMVAGGFVPRGRLRTPKGYELWLFTYVDTYQDTAGTAIKYMPEDQALIGASQARCDRYFGPSETLPASLSSHREQLYQSLFGIGTANILAPPNIKNMGAVINPAMFYNDAYYGPDGKNIVIRTQAAPILAVTMTDAFALLDGLDT